MGVKDLWSVLAPVKQHCGLEELHGKTIAVDLSMWVCEALGVKQMQGAVTRPYLRNLFFRISNLLQLQVNLVFVVDGTPPELKFETMLKRQQARLGPGAARPVKLGKPGRSHFKAWLRECCRMLDTLGVPHVESAGEAEAMCALLDKEGVVDGCLTDDGDAFLYGARTVYRNFTLDRKDPHVEVYRMSDIETKLQLSREKLVAMATLLGCDYVPRGVPGVGRETVIKLMANWGTTNVIERLRRWKSDVSFEHLERQCTSKKPAHCVTCRHPGSATSHRQSGCELCGTRESCVGGATDDQCLCSWHRLQTQLAGFTAELNVRRKALNTPGFPHEKVFQEFLVSKDKVPKKKLEWKQPQLKGFQAFMCDRAEWVSEYGIEKILPLVTLWTMRRIQGGCDSKAPNLLQPHSIVKCRTRQGIACYEVSWHKLAEDQTTEAEYYITVEKQDLFQQCFPVLAAVYESSVEAKKKTKPKGKPKKPPDDLSLPSSQDVLSETEELLSQLSIHTAQRDYQTSWRREERLQGISSSQPVSSVHHINDSDTISSQPSCHSPPARTMACSQPASRLSPRSLPVSSSQPIGRQRCSDTGAWIDKFTGIHTKGRGNSVSSGSHLNAHIRSQVSAHSTNSSHGTARAPSSHQGCYSNLLLQLAGSIHKPNTTDNSSEAASPSEKFLSLRDRLQLRMRDRQKATPGLTQDARSSGTDRQAEEATGHTPAPGLASMSLSVVPDCEDDSAELVSAVSELQIREADESTEETTLCELRGFSVDSALVEKESFIDLTLADHELADLTVADDGSSDLTLAEGESPADLTCLKEKSCVDLTCIEKESPIDLTLAEDESSVIPTSRCSYGNDSRVASTRSRNASRLNHCIETKSVLSPVDLNSHDVTDIVDLCFREGDETINFLPPTWGKKGKKKTKGKSNSKLQMNPDVNSVKKATIEAGRGMDNDKELDVILEIKRIERLAGSNVSKEKKTVPAKIRSKKERSKENVVPSQTRRSSRSSVKKPCVTDMSVMLGLDETIVSGCLEDVTLTSVGVIRNSWDNSNTKKYECKTNNQSSCSSMKSSLSINDSLEPSVKYLDIAVTDFVDLTLSPSVVSSKESHTNCTGNLESPDKLRKVKCLSHTCSPLSRNQGNVSESLADASHAPAKATFITPSLCESTVVDATSGGGTDGTTLCVDTQDQGTLPSVTVYPESSTLYMSPDVSLTLPLDDTVIQQALLESTMPAVTSEATSDRPGDISDTVLLENSDVTDTFCDSVLHVSSGVTTNISMNKLTCCDVDPIRGAPVMLTSDGLLSASVCDVTCVPSVPSSNRSPEQGPHHPPLHANKLSSCEPCNKSSIHPILHDQHKLSADISVDSDTITSPHGSVLQDTSDQSASDSSIIPPSPDTVSGGPTTECHWNRSQVGTFSMELTLLNSTAGSCPNTSGHLELDS